MPPAPTTADDTSLLLGSAQPKASGFGAVSWLRFLGSPKGLALLATVAFPAITLGVLAARAARVAPPSTPSQIAVTLGGDPNTELTVSWAAPRGTPPTAVRWGLSAGALAFTSPASCTSYDTTPDQTGTDQNGTQYPAYASPQLCAAALMAPASPGGAPVFFALDGDAAGVRTTATAPPAGAAGVRIAVMGDVGTTADSASTLARVSASHATAPFAAGLLVGDLSCKFCASEGPAVSASAALLPLPTGAPLPPLPPLPFFYPSALRRPYPLPRPRPLQ
jgi:hypothetical protein